MYTLQFKLIIRFITTRFFQTEEDKKLQDDLNLLILRLTETDPSLHLAALESMRGLIRASTTSMTSVPKPLKFMLPHYAKMKAIYENMSDSPAKVRFFVSMLDTSNSCVFSVYAPT